MKKILLAVALCVFMLCTALSPAIYAVESQVVVSATGRVSIKPDMAKFGVVVKSDARTADQAAAEAAEKYRTVQNSLRTAGIPLEDASTESYTVAPRWEWEPAQGKSLLKGYSARHSIMVRVRHLEKIGHAIDAVVQAGAEEVQRVSFSSSHYDALRLEALALAVENARRDAGIMAKAAGGRLGQLIEVSVSQPSLRDHPQIEAMAMRAAPSPVPTEIAPAEQDIVVTVNSRWRFILTASR
ncbi:MAG: SIMPL domain-containing protein [Chlorobiaceae bacterium]